MSSERGRGIVIALGLTGLLLVVNRQAGKRDVIDPWRGVPPLSGPSYGPPTPDGGPPCGCRPH